MADDGKLYGNLVLPEITEGLEKKVDVFLLRDTPNEQKTHASAVAAELFPKVGVASPWSKESGVESAREDLKFPGVDPALDPALPVLLGVNEDCVKLAVEPVHVFPGETLEEAVLSQDADVLREVGVIDTAHLEVEHLAGEQRGKTNRAGRADNDFRKVFALDGIEQLQDGREAQLLQLVLGQLEFADRFEVLDRKSIEGELAARGDD